MLLLLCRQTGKEKQNFFFSDLPAKENCASVHNALPPENVACCTSLQSPPFPLPARVTKRTLHITMTILNLKSGIFPLYARVIKSMTVSGFPSWQKKCLTVEFKDNGISRKKLTRENRHHVLQKCSYSFPIHDTVFPQYSIWNRATCCLQEATILEERLVTPAHVARPLAPAHPLLLPLHHPLQALRHLHHPLPHRHCLCP